MYKALRKQSLGADLDKEVVSFEVCFSETTRYGSYSVRRRLLLRNALILDV